jgi:hypothetical protein
LLEAMSAPMRWRASSVAAATTSSMALDSCCRAKPAEEGARADAHQPAADVVLEDDDDDEDDRREERREQIEEGDEPAHLDTIRTRER